MSVLIHSVLICCIIVTGADLVALRLLLETKSALFALVPSNHRKKRRGELS